MRNFKEVFKNHIGYENRITKAELCRETGTSERIVRKEIESLRKSGVPIISNSKTNGYWLYDPNSLVDREHYNIMIGELTNRIKNIAEIRTALINEVELKETDIKQLNLFAEMEKDYFNNNYEADKKHNFEIVS